MVTAMPDNFNEDERAMIARWRIASREEVPAGIDAGYWAPTATATRFSLPDRNAAIELATSGAIDAAVITAGQGMPPGAINIGQKWLLVLPQRR